MPSAIDQELVAAIERAFAGHAGEDGVIDLPELQRALGLRSEYLARRVLALFDANGDGVVSRDEFVAQVKKIVTGTDREKLELAFRLHDHDGDGTLDRTEITRMIAMSLAESDIAERVTQTPEHLARVLMGAVDVNRDGRVTFDELARVIAQKPQLLRAMTHNEAIWIAPNEDLMLLADERASGRRVPRRTTFAEHGVAPKVAVGLFFAINAAIFVVSMVHGGAFTAEHPLMEAGRASGRCLDFCGALVLVPMMRRLGTWVRSTWLGGVLPVDDAIDFHKIVGHTLFGWSVVHTAAFVLAFRVGHAPGAIGWLLATSRGLTGAILLGVFAVMWFFSLSFIRRTRRFELFAATHLLWVVWFGLAIAHGPSFLLFAGVPLLGFLVEQALRLARRAPACAVVSSTPKRSGVTRLEIARPKGFTFEPGDYAFLKIPAVARTEWHPFTISSAPERDNLTFHVRSLGNWTSELARRVQAQPDAPGLVAYVDGPYGSPSAHIFEARYAVLIGAGIGVTPFASVLESIVLSGRGGPRAKKLERVHFFWLNRDQVSFEWFSALLTELERLDKSLLLDVHLCMTGARSGATTLGLELARSLMHSAGRSDIVTGLRTHTHTGPPDWEGMLGAIRKEHQGHRVEVFFCGPPGLAKILRPICERLAMPFREERF